MTQSNRYTLDFSDTPLSAVKIITRIPKGQAGGVFDCAFIGEDKSIIGGGFCSCRSTLTYEDWYFASYVFALTRQFGLYNSYTLSGGQGEQMQISYNSNANYQLVPATTNCIAFKYYIYAADPQVLVKGTIIKVYGVRA